METRHGKSGALLMRTLNRFVQIWSVGLAILATIGLVIPAYAATIFTEDYEVNEIGDLAAKGWGLAGGSADIVASPVHGGSKALRFTYQGVHVNDNSNSKIYRTFPATPEIYERYYVRYAPIDPSQPSGFTAITAKQHYLKNEITGIPNFVTNYFFGDRRLGSSSQAPSGTTNLYTNLASVFMDNNRWYCVETHHKFNTPNQNDGLVEIWIDGVLTTRYTGNWRTTETAAAAFNFIEVYRQGADNQYRYEDDFVLSTTRVGCSGSPSADTTPPVAPTGLNIR